MGNKILGSVNSELNEQDEIDREYIKKIKQGDDTALNYIMEKYKNCKIFRKTRGLAWTAQGLIR